MKSRFHYLTIWEKHPSLTGVVINAWENTTYLIDIKEGDLQNKWNKETVMDLDNLKVEYECMMILFYPCKARLLMIKQEYLGLEKGIVILDSVTLPFVLEEI